MIKESLSNNSFIFVVQPETIITGADIVPPILERSKFHPASKEEAIKTSGNVGVAVVLHVVREESRLSVKFESFVALSRVDDLWHRAISLPVADVGNGQSVRADVTCE